MSRYIDADMAIDEIIKDMCGVPDVDEGLHTAISELRLMPIADVVEVVRCEDCKHQGKLFHADARRKDGGYYIYWCDLNDGYSHVCVDDDYCSRGERREDAKIR